MQERKLSVQTRFKRRSVLVGIALMLALLCAYIFLLPQWQARRDIFLEPSDLYGARVVDVLIFSWCLWVGASVGSFLNVVAWRMPRGSSVKGRSHCPRCMSKLRAQDNIPVLGWLFLGGRCFSCRLPISIRYPFVELVVGLSLSAVCVGQLYQFSLPRQTISGLSAIFSSPVVDWRSLVVLIYHLTVLSLSWALGLIRIDGHGLPQSLIKWALLLATVPMILEPSLMVVPWQAEVTPNWLPDGRYLDAVMRILTSLVAATLMARILVRSFCPNADLKLDPLGKPTARLVDLIVILILPSLVIGWHSLAAIVILASVLAAVLQPSLGWKKDALGCFAISLPIAFTLQVVFWRFLHAPMLIGSINYGTWYWPSESGLPWVIMCWVGMTLFVSLWLRDRGHRESQPAFDLPPKTHANHDIVPPPDDQISQRSMVKEGGSAESPNDNDPHFNGG